MSEKIQQNYRLEPVTIKQLDKLQMKCGKQFYSKADLIEIAIAKLYHDVFEVHQDTIYKYEDLLYNYKQEHKRNIE